MPEYLAPGVYVEETSFRSKSIEGVSTTTTGFIGPTRYGPADMEPDVLTSLMEFERVYGDGEPLVFAGKAVTNYMWHSVRAFFANGGKRLYVVRMVEAGGVATGPVQSPIADVVTGDNATTTFPLPATPLPVIPRSVRIARKDPTTAITQTIANGDGATLVFDTRLRQQPDDADVTIAWTSGGVAKTQRIVAAAVSGDGNPAGTRLERATGVLHLDTTGAVPANAAITVSYSFQDRREFRDDGAGQIVGVDGVTGVLGTIVYATGRIDLTFQSAPPTGQVWTRRCSMAQSQIEARFPGAAGNCRLRFRAKGGANLASIPGVLPAGVRLNAVVEVLHKKWKAPQWRRLEATAAGLELTQLPDRPVDKDQDGANIPVTVPFDAQIVRLATASSLAVECERGGRTVGVWEGIDPTPQAVQDFFTASPTSDELRRTLPVVVKSIDAETLYDWFADLHGGTDGTQPLGAAYEGRVDPAKDTKTGLKAFEDIEDISIVAAPGLAGLDAAEMQAGVGVLKAHVELMRYRVAVVDPPKNQSIGEIRQFRSRFDSKHMALYYPWVRVLDPAVKDPTARAELDLPPCGFITGIYARNDIERGVHKAPANEIVNLAVDFERPINKAQQEVLNPEGINCLRFFEGRGLRVWGARTTSSDPEWKYVNVRRYFAYLEHSIDRATQWAVFEPNGPLLWGNIKRSIDDFLLNEYQAGALLGDKPEKAFFVRCDRSTMTQNDLDNGRLVCLIGVAPLKPAEFVIFRIGQWTADAKN